VTLLECINGPEDLKELSQEQLTRLAGEIRDLLIETTTRTGGHLGPNLGVVELTIAIHRVFDSPKDRIVFDTGHQSYVHKLLTGRVAQFGTLKQYGGLTGYPCRAESVHDLVENSHASTSLSYADGLAKAYKLRGEPDRTVVAIIGDGALTGGMAWEALNNIAAAKDSRLVMIVNDNGWSYQPTIGGLAEHLAEIRVSQRYEHVLDYIKTTLSRAPVVGAPLYGTLHGIKKGIKDVLQPQVMFEDLGLKYVGPIDGHDERLVENALRLIPWRFRRRMKNVAIVVEQEAPRPDLLGLYQGRPLATRSVFQGFAMPDKITIFQGPHERLARGEAHLKRMVEDTVWHEVAHYFGLNERQVRAAEKRRGTVRGHRGDP